MDKSHYKPTKIFSSSLVERQDNEEPTFELAVIGLVLATVTGFIFFAGKNNEEFLSKKPDSFGILL